jgi:GAF domain-containing protein
MNDPTKPTTLMRAVAREALDSIEGADHVAITLAGGDRAVIATSDVAAALDAHQIAADAGPVREAIDGRVSRINYMRDTNWTDLKGLCDDHGIRSVVSIPLIVAGTPAGALTVYCEDHHAFGATELRVARATADRIAVALRGVDLGMLAASHEEAVS